MRDQTLDHDELSVRASRIAKVLENHSRVLVRPIVHDLLDEEDRRLLYRLNGEEIMG